MAMATGKGSKLAKDLRFGQRAEKAGGYLLKSWRFGAFTNVSTPMPDSVLYATVHFSGHVQGVGFRYTTLQVAKEYEVAGQVKNLLDGRVLLEVEGRAPEVEAFVAAVVERMHGYVRKTEVAKQNRVSQFQGFVIR